MNEESKEEMLMEAACRAAETAPVVTKEERRKRAGKAANQRMKSEAETCYRIDEQLRKVGWEADTGVIQKVYVLQRDTILLLPNGLLILPLA